MLCASIMIFKAIARPSDLSHFVLECDLDNNNFALTEHAFLLIELPGMSNGKTMPKQSLKVWYICNVYI